MQHGQHNGYPSWDLVEILLGIRHDIGALMASHQITLEEVRSHHSEMRQDIIRAHERMDREVRDMHKRVDREVKAIGKAGRPGWIESLGLSSVKEAVILATLIIGGLTGGLTVDKVLAALGAN